jgi:hypothetical protein
VIEARLQALILARLGLLPDVHVWRMNTGVAHRPGGGAVRFGAVGQADITGLVGPHGRRLEIEIKSATGRQTPEQRAFGERITRLGGLYLVCRSLEDALNGIDEWKEKHT